MGAKDKIIKSLRREMNRDHDMCREYNLEKTSNHGDTMFYCTVSMAFLIPFLPFGRKATCSWGSVRPSRADSRKAMASDAAFPFSMSSSIRLINDMNWDQRCRA